MKKFETAEQTLEFLRSLVDEEGRTNDRGNLVKRGFDSCDRYIFDFNVCTQPTGWHQYDTNSDAHYFGMWYNLGLRVTFSYVEGDLILVEAPDTKAFKAEMEYCAKFYGAPPPAFICIDVENKVETHIFDSNARPDLSSL